MKILFQRTIEPLVRNIGKNALEVGKNLRYTLDDAEIGAQVFTRSFNSCSGVVLNAGDKNFLAHIDPKYFNWKTFSKAFSEQVDRFQQKFGESKAIIFGGWEVNRLDPAVSTPSSEVYSTIAGILDDMPLTMICGKKQDIKPFDNLFANGKEITLASDTFERLGVTSDKIKNMSVEEVEAQLKKAYEWVEIDPSMLA